MSKNSFLRGIEMAVLSEYLTKENSVIDFIEFMDPEHESYRTVDIPRRVGFDRIKARMELLAINWAVIDEVIDREKKYEYKTLRLQECRDINKALYFCNEDDVRHRFSGITLILGDNTLHIQKCNIPDRRDICSFEIVIPWIEGHEILDNISNMTCEMEQDYVRLLIHQVASYGIYLDYDVAELKEVELNVNMYIFSEGNGFRDAIEMLRPFRFCLPRFKDDDRGEASNEEEKFFFPSIDKVFLAGFPHRKKTSFTDSTASIKIKVYDKSSETITKSRGQILFMSPIARLEYVIEDKNEIPFYFNELTNLFEMTQDVIEEAFHKLTDKFVKTSLDKYYKRMNLVLEKYFAEIDINKYAWRKTTVAEIVSMLNRMDGYMIITKEELSRYVSYIKGKSVKKNRARITQSLIEEFKKTNEHCVRITETDTYNELINWLCSIKGNEEQNIIYEVK